MSRKLGNRTLRAWEGGVPMSPERNSADQVPQGKMKCLILDMLVWG